MSEAFEQFGDHDDQIEQDGHSERRERKNLGVKLESCIRELRREGRGLPAKPGAGRLLADRDDMLFDQLDKVVIAAWVRYSPAVDLRLEPFRSILLAGIRQIGIEPARHVSPTLEDLRAALMRAHKNEFSRQVARKAGAAKVKRMLAELDALQRALAVPEGTRLDAIFGSLDDFDAVKVALLSAASDPRTFRRRASVLDCLYEQASNLMMELALPAEFSTRLQSLIIKSGLTLREVAKRSGTNVQRLRRLLSGSQPRLDMMTFVHKLEEVLGTKPGILWSMVSDSRMRIAADDAYTREMCRVLKVAGVHSDFLPADWDRLGRAEKKRVIDWIYKNIVFGTPYRRISRARYERHGALPKVMDEEFQKLRAFKTAAVPRERDFPRKKVVRVGTTTIVYGGKWRHGTAKTAYGYIRKVISAAKALCLDEKNEWQDVSGLSFLIHPDLQIAVSEQIARDRYKQLKKANAFEKLSFREPEDGLVYADADICRLETIMALFNEHTGYFYHRPPALAAIPGLIDQEWVDAALADWKGTVTQSLPKLQELLENITESAQKLRDPWKPIEPLLELDQPLTPVFRALDLMEADRPSFFGTPMRMARHDQAHLLISLLLHGRLRRANYGKLTWRKDGTGNLRWDVKGYWKFIIPQKDMKNEGSSALPEGGADLVLILDKDDPRLYQAIERWLGVVDPETGRVDEVGSSRRLLHGADCGDALFPGNSPGLSLSEGTISAIVYRFSALYLTGRPWSSVGVAGVTPFGPHAVRDLVASHILKNTANIHEAAAALFDHPDTLKAHYARFTFEEKSKRTNNIVRNTIQR